MRIDCLTNRQRPLPYRRFLNALLRAPPNRDIHYPLVMGVRDMVNALNFFFL